MQHKAPDMSKIPGGWEDNSTLNLNGNKSVKIDYLFKVINRLDSNLIKEYFETSKNWQDVSIQGMTEGKNFNSKKGSSRTTLFNANLSEQIFERYIKGNIHSTIKTHSRSFTDCWQDVEDKNPEWELVGMSPMLRYMVYENDGQHYPHYDAGYFYEDGIHRTLKSVVIYLTTNETGATRFIEDNQALELQCNRNNEDWDRPAYSYEVFSKFLPQEGSILIFDHRYCHDVEQFLPKDKNERRIIIRGDLIYKLKK